MIAVVFEVCSRIRWTVGKVIMRVVCGVRDGVWILELVCNANGFAELSLKYFVLLKLAMYNGFLVFLCGSCYLNIIVINFLIKIVFNYALLDFLNYTFSLQIKSRF